MIPVVTIYKKADGVYRAPDFPFTDHGDIVELDETQATQIDVEVRVRGAPVKMRAWTLGTDDECHIDYKQYSSLFG
jgi:hypothetical protein